jgi:hypothetical protein
MATYRRIIEIDAGEDSTIFKTIRADVPEGSRPKRIIREFVKLLDGHKGSYETQARFVPPRAGQDLGDYYPKQPGEDFWDWLDDDNYEEI